MVLLFAWSDGNGLRWSLCAVEGCGLCVMRVLELCFAVQLLEVS